MHSPKLSHEYTYACTNTRTHMCCSCCCGVLTCMNAHRYWWCRRHFHRRSLSTSHVLELSWIGYQRGFPLRHDTRHLYRGFSRRQSINTTHISRVVSEKVTVDSTCKVRVIIQSSSQSRRKHTLLTKTCKTKRGQCRREFARVGASESPTQGGRNVPFCVTGIASSFKKIL